MSKLLVLVAAAAIMCIACGADRHPADSAPTTPEPQLSTIVIAPGSPIKIGVSAALSGDQVNLGTDIADAAELAVSDAGAMIKGHQVQIARADDACTDAEKASSVARTLIADPAVAGVIGPMCTTGAQAADSLYETAGLVHLTPSATRVDLSEQGERYFFRTSWRDDVQAMVQAHYARHTLGDETAVVIDDGDPYGRALADAFIAAFEGDGGRVLARERIKPDATDFATVAGEAQTLSPDIVVFEGLNPAGGLLIRSLRFAQYTGHYLAPDGVLSVRDFFAAADKAGEGAILTGGVRPDDAFVSRFHDRFGRTPSTPFVLQAHDATRALVAAINAVATDAEGGGLTIDRAALGERLRSEPYLGLSGSIHFDERGDRQGESATELGLAVYRVTESRFEPVP